MEFHDNYPQYEIMSNHDEAHGKKSRRTLWNVFWVMLAITIFELIIGFLAPSKGWSGTLGLKTLFISLTIAKAAAIVWWFMHLGHEVKFFKYTILMPYIIFIVYTIFIVLTEGTYAGTSGHFTKVDPIFKKQQEALKSGHHGGGEAHEQSSAHEATEAH
ncbi:MAG: cytochrome C oxidase subunit IV family protein [Bacteroidetes bacterium]|nr:cytochrome C oxidase subunit IV family protein [Bacteroidota bacterium]